jgi:hypothetical protein
MTLLLLSAIAQGSTTVTYIVDGAGVDVDSYASLSDAIDATETYDTLCNDVAEPEYDASGCTYTINIDYFYELNAEVTIGNGMTVTINGTKLFGGLNGTDVITVEGAAKVRLEDIVINGRLVATEDSSLTLDGVMIDNAATSDGGVVYADQSHVTILNSVMSGETSTPSDKAGAIYFFGPDHKLIVRDSTFLGNKAWFDADRVTLLEPPQGKGGAIFATRIGGMELSRNVFSGTAAADAGAIFVEHYEDDSSGFDEPIWIHQNEFCISQANGDRNGGGAQGGAIKFTDVDNILVTNNTFVSTGAALGGAIYFDGEVIFQDTVVREFDLQITNNHFLGPAASAQSGGDAAIFIGMLPTIFYNNLISTGSTTAITGSAFDLGSTINFEYNLINHGGQLLGSDLNQYALSGSNIFGQDPRIVDLVVGSQCGLAAFYTEPDSPVIDAGHPDAEWNDNMGGTYVRNDIGAFGGPYRDDLIDFDSDNWADIYDCDDYDPLVNADAIEECDGFDVDENCNGLVDEDLESFVWVDADGDGSGDPDYPTGYCDGIEPKPTIGYSDDDGDCDDTDDQINPSMDELCNDVDDNCDGFIDEAISTLYFRDADGDTWGDNDTFKASCDGQPSGYVLQKSDCDDQDEDVNPLAFEVCDNIDNNCDGDVDEGLDYPQYLDQDGDGYGDADLGVLVHCETISGYAEEANDCDDDDDTVGGADTWYFDADQDGLGDPESGVISCTKPSSDYVKNANDCDDTNIMVGEPDTWWLDWDQDGFGSDQGPANPPADFNTDWIEIEACSQLPFYSATIDDCNDDDPNVNPNAQEYCFDLVDSNCDGDEDAGSVDAGTWHPDADGDGYGNMDTDKNLTQCERPSDYVTDELDRDCDDDNAAINPGEPEVCDGIDNNCNLFIDDEDVEAVELNLYHIDNDGDGHGAGDFEAGCEAPTKKWVEVPIDAETQTYTQDCDDTDVNTYPGADEICDDKDNDCDSDGSIDEDPVNAVSWYVDADDDGVGTGVPTVGCDAPDATWTAVTGDCDDADQTVGVCSTCGGCSSASANPASGALAFLLLAPALARRRR